MHPCIIPSIHSPIYPSTHTHTGTRTYIHIHTDRQSSVRPSVCPSARPPIHIREQAYTHHIRTPPTHIHSAYLTLPLYQKIGYVSINLRTVVYVSWGLFHASNLFIKLRETAEMVYLTMINLL